MVDDIGSAIERLETAVARRPGFGVGTSHSVTTLGEGLRCSTVEGRVDDRDRSAAGHRRGRVGADAERAAAGRARELHGDDLPVAGRPARRRVDLGPRVTVETDSELAGMLLCDAAAPPGYHRDPLPRRGREPGRSGAGDGDPRRGRPAEPGARRVDPRRHDSSHRRRPTLRDPNGRDRPSEG